MKFDRYILWVTFYNISSTQFEQSKNMTTNRLGIFSNMALVQNSNILFTKSIPLISVNFYGDVLTLYRIHSTHVDR